MKKSLLFICLLATVAGAFAQDAVKPEKKKNGKVKFGGDGVYLRDSTWRIGGNVSVLLSQTALYQWGPGGNNNFAFLLSGNFYANYKKGKLIADNSIDAKWGMVANGLIRNKALAQSNLQKNIDLLAIKSMVGYQISKSLYAAAKLGFESQFTPTYDYSLTDTTNGRFRRYTVSKFAAPAVLTIGPGLTWKPKEYFTLFFSPVEGKMTFVTKDNPRRDTTTAADGTFTDAYYSNVDETRFGLKRGDFFMGELGWELDLLFQKEIIKNVSWKSHLNVFGAYLNASYNTNMPVYYSDQDSMGVVTIKETMKHIPVVKWDNDIVLKVNSWLSATLSAKFVYQYNALVPIDTRKNDTGKKGPDGITDKDKVGTTVNGYNKLQIFEQFGVGLTAKF
jgi:hypothetical protein